MYNARIDVENQQFIIEDMNGNMIAIRSMPHFRAPNPGRELLMANELNKEAWNRICDLIQDANSEEFKYD